MENREIGVLKSDLDVDKLLGMLNEALDQEWLTYYQSWIGAILMEGPMWAVIKPELFIHSNQELSHATLIKTRMLQLGAELNLNSLGSMKNPYCKVPDNPYITVILHQNLTEELSAIERYSEIADFTEGKDETTHQIVSYILNEELTHERNIENWLDAIALIKSQFIKTPALHAFIS